MMKLHKTLLAALCAATMGFSALPTISAAQTVYFNTAPPPARVEVVPAPRSGHIWVSGYWDMRGNRHHWVRGHWERDRRGYRFSEPRWTERDNRWYLERPRWARDRDGDGVPNRLDRRPDNPRRQ